MRVALQRLGIGVLVIFCVICLVQLYQHESRLTHVEGMQADTRGHLSDLLSRLESLSPANPGRRSGEREHKREHGDQPETGAKE